MRARAPRHRGSRSITVLDVICWKWKPKFAYRSTFEGRHVNVLRNMVARHLHLPHRFSCITDDPSGIDSDVRVIPIGEAFADIRNPSLSGGPSCYRRLQMFSEDARERIGERIVSLDLDVVITADITPLFDRPEDFVIADGVSLEKLARAARPYCIYNGSVLMLRAGARRKVFEAFDARRSPQLSHCAGSKGSDQGWISFILGRHEKTWSKADGIYSYANHIECEGGALPADARIVLFHGKHDPWHPDVQRYVPWVREHYC